MLGHRTATMVACIALLVPGDCWAQADDEHLGLTEYELACMPCHGMNGRGDGPLAKGLKARPSDLTQIAKSSGGKFPTSKIFDFIDGRAAVAAHGAREMPVWAIAIASLVRRTKLEVMPSAAPAPSSKPWYDTWRRSNADEASRRRGPPQRAGLRLSMYVMI